jgi:hypothetical protein
MLATFKLQHRLPGDVEVDVETSSRGSEKYRFRGFASDLPSYIAKLMMILPVL